MKGLEVRIKDNRTDNFKIYVVTPTEDEYEKVAEILNIKQMNLDWED